jgi:MoaA/NifB/PqqE/SkfB family radical SAM enzyme
MKWLGLLRYLTLQIEVTTSCNLDCKICMRHYLERPASSLSLDDFKKVLASGNFRYVGLHGWGEPMLNRQLFEMIGYAESSGVSTNLTTNGTLIGDKIDDVFASGLREIAFGIYDRELFLKSLPRIKELVREKNRRRSKIPKTYLDITIYKENLAQIPELVGELAPEAAVDAVILHRLFNVHKVDPSLEYISVEEEDELFDKVRRLARTLKLEIYLPPKHSFPCRIVKRSIFVTAEGKVTPCCFLPEFYVGNAFEEGIQKSLRSKAYTEFVRNMKKHPICSQCRW